MDEARSHCANATRLSPVVRALRVIGRGVDLIYEGLLRYGRPATDYTRRDAQNVVVELSGGKADLALFRLIVEEERRRGTPLPVDAIIALGCLRRERRLDTAMLSEAIRTE